MKMYNIYADWPKPIEATGFAIRAHCLPSDWNDASEQWPCYLQFINTYASSTGMAKLRTMVWPMVNNVDGGLRSRSSSCSTASAWENPQSFLWDFIRKSNISCINSMSEWAVISLQTMLSRLYRLRVACTVNIVILQPYHHSDGQMNLEQLDWCKVQWMAQHIKTAELATVKRARLCGGWEEVIEPKPRIMNLDASNEFRHMGQRGHVKRIRSVVSRYSW